MLHAVDSHTEGMPTRVITGGVGVIPGATMNDKRLHFIAHLDHIRRLLMNEPRGHASMSGAILQPPVRPDATSAWSTSRSAGACRCAATEQWASQRFWSRPEWCR